LANSLTTPEVIRTFQRNLYAKAKSEPEFRFYSLYDKVHRRDILEFAYRQCRANGGASGVDGMTFERIEAAGLEGWLVNLQEDLRNRTYKPQPVRRVMILKPGGGERPLGIPTIRDRVAQTAAKIVLEPIFEADFEDSAYGYRPGRSATDAIREVHRTLIAGHTEVVDADISAYFDTIPHSELLKCVARRVSDKAMLKLVKLWLKTPVEERDKEGGTRMTGGKRSACGTPQGGVLSPLLANIYMRRLLLYFRMSGAAERFQARIVNYADDFVILCRQEGRKALEWTKRVTERIGLQLNESKTSVKDGRRDNFNFLGYTFGPMIWRKNGARYLGASPSRKAEKRLCERVKGLLYRGNPTPWPELCQRLNRLLTGWANYFSYGSRSRIYCRTDRYVEDRVRRFLRKRHKITGQGTRRFAHDVIYGERGVVCLMNLKKERLACPA